MPVVREFGTTRRYRRVFLLSLLTFGIYYIIYQWRLFEDLQDHFDRAFHTEPRSFPTRNNPTTMLIFLILFPIYAYYIKYQTLHQHIESSNIKTQDNCLDGTSSLLSFIFLCWCTFGIYPLMMESKWQNAFNEHIIAHETSK